MAQAQAAHQAQSAKAAKQNFEIKASVNPLDSLFGKRGTYLFCQCLN